MKQYKKGFTLIELLVVIAIIGILSTLAVVSLGNARQRARDTKRLADIRNIQTALELFYSQNNNYPVFTTAGGTNIIGQTLCTAGPWQAGTACTAPASLLITVPAATQAGDQYQYLSLGTGNSSYSIHFVLEGTAGVVTQDGCASPSGIVNLTPDATTQAATC